MTIIVLDLGLQFFSSPYQNYIDSLIIHPISNYLHFDIDCSLHSKLLLNRLISRHFGPELSYLTTRTVYDSRGTAYWLSLQQFSPLEHVNFRMRPLVKCDAFILRGLFMESTSYAENCCITLRSAQISVSAKCLLVYPTTVRGFDLMCLCSPLKRRHSTIHSSSYCWASIPCLRGLAYMHK